MSDKLELKVVFSAVDKFLRPVKAITEGARAASKELKATKDALKGLSDQQKLVDKFRSTNTALGIDGRKLEEARVRVKQMAEAMAATATPTVAMQRAFAAAREEAAQLSANVNRLRESKQRLRHELSAIGIDTKNLASQQRDLKGKIDAATTAVKHQSDALEVQNQKMKRLHAARATYNKSMAGAGKVAAVGAGAMATGAAMGLPAVKATRDYADFETAMLGVARQVNDARDANGKLTRTYYEIGDAVKAMSERLPMAANDIAKIVEAGARMGIQGKENLLIYAETTAIMANAFDLPVDKIGDDIGKISQLYKVPMKDIKALGDTINWLDDNALAKGGDIIEVMKRIAGTADMVKMNFKEAAALGSTFLSLGAAPEVAATASNAMIRELSIATMQTKRFRGGLEMLKMDAKSIQLGMNKDATGTIIKVLEAIKRLPEEKQLEAATRLFGKEYGDDAAKLASNLDEYRRQLKLVNDEKARGSMQRESDTRGQTINARLDMAKNAFTNLSSDLGEHLKPALVATLETTLSIIQSVRNWAKENPQLAGGIMTVVKWLAIGITVIGGLLVAGAAVLAPLAMMKFGLTTLGISIGPLAGALGSILSPIAKITLAFTAGYAAGTLLNEGINKGLSSVLGYETTLGGSIFDLVETIKSKFGEMVTWFQALPQRLMDAGVAMIDGFIKGIMARWEALKETVSNVAGASVDWVKEKLGIRSPSRVFAEIGGYTMQGLEQGISGSEDGPMSAVGSMAKKLAGIGAGLALGGSAMAGDIGLDMRPPINPAAMMGGMMGGGGGNTYSITIQAAPGTDNQGLAALVAREIEKIEAKKASQKRSRLRDSE